MSTSMPSMSLTDVSRPCWHSTWFIQLAGDVSGSTCWNEDSHVVTQRKATCHFATRPHVTFMFAHVSLSYWSTCYFVIHPRVLCLLVHESVLQSRMYLFLIGPLIFASRCPHVDFHVFHVSFSQSYTCQFLISPPFQHKQFHHRPFCHRIIHQNQELECKLTKIRICQNTT